MAINAPEPLNHARRQVGLVEGRAIDIESLVHAYYDQVYRLSLSILDDADEADDAAQETFVAASTRLDQFRGQSSVKTWLFAIAVNECRGIMRRRKKRRRLLDALSLVQNLVAKPPSPEESVSQTETEDLLITAVQTLKEKHRLPLVLRYVHSLTAPEIAEVLGIREGTVHSRLHYARRTLRRTMKGME